MIIRQFRRGGNAVAAAAAADAAKKKHGLSGSHKATQDGDATSSSGKVDINFDEFLRNFHNINNWDSVINDAELQVTHKTRPVPSRLATHTNSFVFRFVLFSLVLLV